MLCVAGLGCNGDGTKGMRNEPPRPRPRPLRDIISAIDANAALLNQALWSSTVHVATRFRDESGRLHTFDLDGTLLFRPPHSLRLDLSHPLGEKVMQVGSNDDEYWVWIAPEVRRMWWGRHRNVGRACARRLVVQPNELICALGVAGLPRDDSGELGPTRIHGRQHDILRYWRRIESGEYRLAREYRVDLAPPHLVRVVVFRDEFGDYEVSAYLDEHRPAWPGGPLVPHAIHVISHKNRDEFTLRMKAAEPRPDNAIAPRAFLRPTDRLPAEIGDNIVQIDDDCD